MSLWFALSLLAALLPAEDSFAHPGSLETGVHNGRVEISIDYQGDYFSLYGRAPEGTTDIVAVLESPHCSPLKLVRKGRVMGLWFGVKQFRVTELPDLYLVNVTGKDAEGLCAKLDDHGGAGYGALTRRAVVERLRGEAHPNDEQMVLDGLLELKKKSGMYAVRPGSIHLGADGTFHHLFAIPDGAATGTYEITTYVLKAGQLLDTATDEVVIERVGLVARLFQLAQKHALAYGVMTVIVALVAGLLVGLVFKKGGGH